MNDLTTVRELFSYTEWADAVVWNAVLDQPSAIADERIRDYFHHIHIVEDLFLKVWLDEKIESFSKEVPALPSIFANGKATHQRIAVFLSELEEARLSEVVSLPWAGLFTKATGREPATITMGDTLLQVVNHSTYHRGQVNSRLRELGGTPPMTDLIAWVAIGKPNAAWE
jgi:uncharacterized damage-inducible protein DinB